MASVAFKKKMVKRLTSAQAKAAVKAMKSKGKKTMGKMPMSKMSTKFTPPGYTDAEDKIDHGADEDEE